MGQNNSQQSLRLQYAKSHSNHRRQTTNIYNSVKGSSKTLYICANRIKISIYVPEDNLTCGWLLSEVIRNLYDDRVIVALKTVNNNEILDYWLTDYERNLQPFKDGEHLSVYHTSNE